jgi:hypothetical protein
MSRIYPSDCGDSRENTGLGSKAADWRSSISIDVRNIQLPPAAGMSVQATVLWKQLPSPGAQFYYAKNFLAAEKAATLFDALKAKCALKASLNH